MRSVATRTFDQIGLLGLYTETSLHCGTESTVGYVDLPIQRERHTEYPVIQGSTIKGVLKDECRHRSQELALSVEKTFGRPGAENKDDPSGSAQTEKDGGIPGSVSFGDGILVAFPVRSSEAPFHWVTCPFVLERVLRLFGQPWDCKEPPAGVAWASSTVATSEVLLEELLLTISPNDAVGDSACGALSYLMKLLPNGDHGFAYTREMFAKRLLVVSDEDFRFLVTSCTAIVTRIKLNVLGTTRDIDRKDTKEIATIKQELGLSEEENLDPIDLQGNLFVEELVPPETLFVCPLRAATASAAATALTTAFKQMAIIRIGGDETIGRGVTHLTYFAHTRAGGVR